LLRDRGRRRLTEAMGDQIPLSPKSIALIRNQAALLLREEVRAVKRAETLAELMQFARQLSPLGLAHSVAKLLPQTGGEGQVLGENDTLFEDVKGLGVALLAQVIRAALPGGGRGAPLTQDLTQQETTGRRTGEQQRHQRQNGRTTPTPLAPALGQAPVDHAVQRAVGQVAPQVRGQLRGTAVARRRVRGQTTGQQVRQSHRHTRVAPP